MRPWLTAEGDKVEFKEVGAACVVMVERMIARSVMKTRG